MQKSNVLHWGLEDGRLEGEKYDTIVEPLSRVILMSLALPIKFLVGLEAVMKPCRYFKIFNWNYYRYCEQSNHVTGHTKVILLTDLLRSCAPLPRFTHFYRFHISLNRHSLYTYKHIVVGSPFICIWEHTDLSLAILTVSLFLIQFILCPRPGVLVESSCKSLRKQHWIFPWGI